MPLYQITVEHASKHIARYKQQKSVKKTQARVAAANLGVAKGSLSAAASAKQKSEQEKLLAKLVKRHESGDDRQDETYRDDDDYCSGSGEYYEKAFDDD